MRVCELFAGVGGFRLGLENANPNFNTVFFSQWEPAYKTQFAYDCYVNHWKSEFEKMPTELQSKTNIDIHNVNKNSLPDFDLLVGGFPCQDYSVAHSLSSSKGIEGKKGVLFWDIRDTLEAKNPPFVLLENVDRLLKSPAKQRGRDFAIMLKCFDDLDYKVEWRVINAADYSQPQKRRRVFIFAVKNDTNYYHKDEMFFEDIFPCKTDKDYSTISLENLNIGEISDTFTFNFENSGLMKNGIIYSRKVTPICSEPFPLKNILLPAPDEKHYLVDEEKWKYLKGAKKKERTTKEGYTYLFSEGAIPYPDNIDVPARTMLTSECTVNRSSHIVPDPKTGRLRTLLPQEAEQIQTFPIDWTKGMTEKQRFFCMGNALVVNLITIMGKKLYNIFNDEK